MVSGTRTRAAARPAGSRAALARFVGSAGLALFGAGLLTAGVFAACGGDPIYVYQGQRFDPARGCLERPSSLDVVEGPTEPRECPAVCLVQAAADGTRTTYVAFTCAPYPVKFDATGNDPSCGAALAAAAQKSGCLPEAGVPEAGPADAEGGADAALIDAGADASPGADASDASNAGDVSADAADAADGD